MRPNIHIVTETELHMRRAAALGRIDLSENALRERARLFLMSPTESEVWDELRRIDFLLGE